MIDNSKLWRDGAEGISPKSPGKGFLYFQLAIVFPFTFMLSLFILVVSVGSTGESAWQNYLLLLVTFVGIVFAVFMLAGTARIKFDAKPGGLEFRNFFDTVELSYFEIAECYKGKGAYFFSYMGNCIHVVCRDGRKYRILGVPSTYLLGDFYIDTWVDYINYKANSSAEDTFVSNEASPQEPGARSRMIIARVAISITGLAIALIVSFKFHNPFFGLPIVALTRYGMSRINVSEFEKIDSDLATKSDARK